MHSENPATLAHWWRAFLIAARFLTRAPLPDPAALAPLQDGDFGRAALWYPMVGLLLGGLLGLLMWLLGSAPAPTAALLVVILWVWGTGALHLDGLADCADAWVGGLGDRSRTLAILKDPHLGVMGGVTLLLAVLAKWSALWTLGESGAAAGGKAMIAILLAPALARMQILVLALTTPPATEAGMGAALKASLPGRAAWMVIAAGWLIAGLWLGWNGWVWLALAGLSLVLWRASVMHRLGGFTGDTAGALVEITEVVLLATAAILWG